MTERFDVYQFVTDTVIRQLEAGVPPWRKPWAAGGARLAMPLRAGGEGYRGINVLLLWTAAEEHGFGERRWMTFKQAQDLGGNVRKGERGTKVVYAGKIEREGEGADGEAATVKIPFMKAYTVFNIEQVEGLSADLFETVPAPQGEPADRIPAADAFFDALGADVRHGGDVASYSPTHDFIRLPHFDAFRDAESYYATRAHETVHWTRHPSRLDRDFGRLRWGDEGYAREELVAEIGAAFLCCDLGLSPEPREDHAAYLASWLKVLKGDKRAIFSAASAAQRACDYLKEAATADALAA